MANDELFDGDEFLPKKFQPGYCIGRAQSLNSPSSDQQGPAAQNQNQKDEA